MADIILNWSNELETRITCENGAEVVFKIGKDDFNYIHVHGLSGNHSCAMINKKSLLELKKRLDIAQLLW